MRQEFVDILMELVRAGISDYMPTLPDNVNWDTFFNLIDRQGASGACLNGIYKIS